MLFNHPCCAKNILFVSITDESQPAYSQSQYDIVDRHDYDVVAQCINGDVETNRFAIFQTYDDDDAPSSKIFKNGWETWNSVNEFYDLQFTTASTEPEDPYWRFMPDDLISFIEPMLESPDRLIIWLGDNSGSITLSQIENELREVVQYFAANYENEQIVAEGSEQYFRDWWQLIRLISRGDWQNDVDQSRYYA